MCCLYFLSLHHIATGCNHKSALERKDFVTSAVLDLLATGCILKVDLLNGAILVPKAKVKDINSLLSLALK